MDETASILRDLRASQANLFLTGKAGTGKTTLLRDFAGAGGGHVAVLAPTGVAALLAQGQTIHSFFQFRPGLLLPGMARWPEGGDIHRRLETLIIDEISMVRADVFDAVDSFLRRWGPVRGEPFGGVKVVCAGDLFQLPPVLLPAEEPHYSWFYPSRYFFDSKAFLQGNFRILELTRPRRQSDARLLSLLTGLRSGRPEPEALAALNERVAERPADGEGVSVTLSATNAVADALNVTALGRLSGQERWYRGVPDGDIRVFEDLPVDDVLRLKLGAQVMFVRNGGRRPWVNGTLGKVRRMFDNALEVEIHGRDSDSWVEVERERFEKLAYVFENGAWKQRAIGSFLQFPLRLSWAVTIHKSQGKTFDRVHLDLGRGAFEHGQTYVALSRCTSLDGLTLERPVRAEDVKVDPEVIRFHERFGGGSG